MKKINKAILVSLLFAITSVPVAVSAQYYHPYYYHPYFHPIHHFQYSYPNYFYGGHIAPHPFLGSHQVIFHPHTYLLHGSTFYPHYYFGRPCHVSGNTIICF